ncbi:CDP-glucose 4,6-dehydratase [Aminithiophilus ramosus]|uniref:CDP-glucose 4,6-dehydratase n=1 Tax=Aminithiophilus ramosus TaxID=3029084 RepID=UPI0023688261|nr:CDP-glucose 4,6-dehydratase [Aminithiophilus ramosus]
MTPSDRVFWEGRSVFVTGHTGFKGGWLSLWLASLGARVHGYALATPTEPSLFGTARVADRLASSTTGDIADLDRLRSALVRSEASVLFHLAAQPLVRDSYRLPVETYATNVLGTAKVLEAARSLPSLRSVVVVTTDKCYENREWCWGYREEEPLGGHDPYSSSKACAELVTAAYRRSFFPPERYGDHGVAVATARAGNVIGGGDWASDRLVPDCLKALAEGRPVSIRNPASIRPWQHVLEPLSGYLLLGRRLVEEGPDRGEAWNFGPAEGDDWPVERLVEGLCALWGEGRYDRSSCGDGLHEAAYLRLDCAKARSGLGWRPRWNLVEALRRTVDWHRAYLRGEDLQALCLTQIADYERGKRVS